MGTFLKNISKVTANKFFNESQWSKPYPPDYLRQILTPKAFGIFCRKYILESISKFVDC